MNLPHDTVAVTRRSSVTHRVNGPEEIHLPCRLDYDGFEAFVDGLTKQMGQPMAIVSELLILCGLQMQTGSQGGSELANKIKVSQL